MSLRYLLDTNMLSDLVRKPRGIIAGKISDVGEDAVCTSIIVASELRFGAIKSGSKPLQQQVDLILSVLTILPLETPVDNHYGIIRYRLGVQGTPIGPNDMLIAAHALTTGLIVVTANIKEFSRVPDLIIENWLT